MSSPAKVLIIAGKQAQALRDRFEQSGYACRVAANAEGALVQVKEQAPDAVVISGSAGTVGAAVTRLRQEPLLAQVPLVARTSGRRRPGLSRPDLDALAGTDDELVARLEASLTARASLARDARARQRTAALLELTQAAALAIEPEELFVLALPRLQAELERGQALGLVQDGQPLRARLVDALGRVTPVELAASPQLARVFSSRPSGAVEGFVAHVLVLEPDHAAALLVKTDQGPLPPEDLAFIAHFARAMQGAARNVRTQQALKVQALALESAYLDRYQELLEANRRLKELDKWKDELLAVCSHDLRSPLNVVLGHASMLREDPRLEPEQRASLEKIERQGQRILALVERLLDRGRLTERLVLESQPLDLSALVKEEVQQFELMARQRGITLRAETPVSVVVAGDELKLRRVFQNLLTNAFDHAGGLKQLVARVQRLARPGGEVARVSIQDDGAGVSPQGLARLFDRFQSEVQGLGLTICREIVELHGGEIWAEPAPGQGSIFSVTLPTRPEAPLKAQGAERPTVLLVEDDQALAQACLAALSPHYRVELAADGAEAVEKARALRPEVVVMDVFMPKRDGLDATATLNAAEETADLPVLLMSGHPGLPTKLKGLGLSNVEHLKKPFAMADLLTRVDALLRRRHGTAPGQRRLGNDPETGLYDQLGIVRRLEEEVARNRRFARPLTLAVLRPGRAPGLRLRGVAAGIRRALVPPDVVGHLGNGVFALVFPESAEAEVRARLAELAKDPALEPWAYAFKSADLTDHSTSAASALERLLT